MSKPVTPPFARALAALMALPAALLAAKTVSAGEVTSAAAARAIALRRSRVAEFELIRQAAEELGIRVWLFGGTAAGFAHYVRWDLEREGGDPRYPATFFDYDFTNIYRSTQDADLVVDASPEQAAALEALIQEKMSFLQGSKDHWEVRLLRRDRAAPGGQVKQALLHNPDFLDQHTDSNSTGMIELTEPPPGEGVVRDLRDWESPTPFFLQDVARGRLHYYWSPGHEATTRFREGHNPALFSVIRYLVKAFQYDLAIDGEDRARIEGIIEEFHPQDREALSEWARGWLERYGPNLFRHSVDIERSWNTLEALGLRQKLIALSDPSREGSLGWWLSREPLRTEEVGQGAGKTAAELGIEGVAHETGKFVDYESITRDMKGRPNVLISRPGSPGEFAAEGPGFYTLQGRKGARDTGLTIRFRVDPQAREGTDFTVHGQVVVFQNRAALTVISESLEASMLQYFGRLREGLGDPSDRGAWMKLKRRLSLRPLDPAEEAAMVALVSQEIDRFDRSAGPSPSAVLEEWASLPLSRAHPELTRALYLAVRRGLQRSHYNIQALEKTWFALPASRAHPELLLAMIDRHTPADYRERGIRPRVSRGQVVDAILRLPGWSDSPALIDGLMQRGMSGHALRALGETGWRDHPQRALQAIEGLSGRDTRICRELFSVGATFVDHPDLLTRMTQRGQCGQDLYMTIVNEPRNHRPELLLALVEGIAGVAPGASYWSSPEWVDDLIREEFGEDSRLRELCGGGDPQVGCLSEGLTREQRAREVETAAEVTEEVVEVVASLSPLAQESACGPTAKRRRSWAGWLRP